MPAHGSIPVGGDTLGKGPGLTHFGSFDAMDSCSYGR
jgi:hypothetical protein